LNLEFETAWRAGAIRLFRGHLEEKLKDKH